MYKIYKDFISGKEVGVQRLSDKACIPFDPDNTDYQAYLKHIAEGGVPLPAEETQ